MEWVQCGWLSDCTDMRQARLRGCDVMRSTSYRHPIYLIRVAAGADCICARNKNTAALLSHLRGNIWDWSRNLINTHRDTAWQRSRHGEKAKVQKQ